MRTRRLIWGFWFTLIVLALVQPSAASALQLLRITPIGEDVPASRQLVLQFDRPVVPLGRMERRADEVPVVLSPTLACAWRWLNPTTLACQLDDDTAMAPATRYQVTLNPGLTARDGSTLTQSTTQSFTTQRPKLRHVWFETWKSPRIPELEVMFNQSVTGSSVSQHLYLQPVTGTRVAISARPSPHSNGRVWLIQPQTELPADTRIQLRIEPGLRSQAGPEPGVEKRIAVEFDTFPAFRFLGVRCTPNHQKSVTIPPHQPLAAQAKCNPLNAVALLFSTPVIKEALKDRLQVTPTLASGSSAADPWVNVRMSSRLSFPHTKGQPYEVRLPDALQAHTVYQFQTTPPPIQDVFGRALMEPIRMQVAMDHRPPSYHLHHPVSVLEQQVETHLPLIVTNLETVHLDYETRTVDGRTADQSLNVPLEPAEDIARSIPLKVRELLPHASGAIQGRIRSTPKVQGDPPWFFAQVTPFHVHVKLGHTNTLVWVTRFDTGLPVADASIEVEAETFGQFADAPKVLTRGTTNAEGIAQLAGSQDLDPDLSHQQSWRRFAPHLTVRIQHEGDIALVPLIYDFQVRAYGPNKTYIPTTSRRQYGHIRTWGVTAQGVYKAGDTVQYKLMVRDQDTQQFIPAPRAGYTLKIIDPTDKVVDERADITLSEFGSYHGELTVSEQAAVGWYRFVLSLTDTPHTWEPLRVLISDFTPAPFRVTTDLNGTQFADQDQVTVSTHANLHAGGPYTDAPARITAQIRGQSLKPTDPAAAGFWFDVLQQTSPQTVFQSDDKVDAAGELHTQFTIQNAQVLYGQLRVESAVQDDRGKSITHQATARYVGRDRFVGVRQEDWVLQTGQVAQLQTVVVNEHGMISSGTPIQVKIEQLQLKAAQVKGAGNTYLTHYEREWVHLASCTQTSTRAPSQCAFTPPAPGTYQFTASIVDTQGRPQQSQLTRWAVGPGEVVWEQAPGHALQITPENPTVTVGSTARYLVQNPYPGAQALVTIERYGVQKSWVQTFQNSLELIEFPITADQLPGFYLSVVVMSPRVAQPSEAGQIDLGKPAFRLGYVRVPVRDNAKELVVRVTPHQPTYKPRQTATIDLQVATRQGETPPVELAIAVLDEAVFDLIQGGRSYFDPYAGFYTLDALDVRNYNLLTHLIGRQKFEKKGANPGGGGGELSPSLRSVFKFVSYWNPALKPDATGRATIQVPLPDNLTGWRVLAMAVTSTDRMGLGEGQFTVNQPIELRPALPNQVTAGDRFNAVFTVMNRTDKTRPLTVALTATGPIAPTPEHTISIQAEPYQRYPLSLPLQATQAGQIKLEARAGDGKEQDAIQVPLTVHQRFTLDTAASYASTTDEMLTEQLAIPSDIRTDTGSISVVVSPTVLGGLDGTFDYMRKYPYSCWEQVLTKGVTASHYRTLKRYLEASLTWPNSAKLPIETLQRAANFQAPNGGMAYYQPQDQYVSPYLSAYTALAFNWLRSSGHAIPDHVESRLHDYLLTYLRRDVAPSFYSPGMSSTVRAVALAALSSHHKIQRSDIERYRPHLPEMSLFGKAHYLMALEQVPGTKSLQADVTRMIQSHADETSGKLTFTESIDSAYTRILASPLRTTCAVLSALQRQAAQSPELLGDLPFKIVRTITQSRQNRNRWENTQENMFCLQALLDYSRVYERDKPQLAVQAYVDAVKIGEASLESFTTPAVELQRPLQPSDLGQTSNVTIKRTGQGRLYTTTRLTYAPSTLPTQPVNAGMTVVREYSVERDGKWQLLSSPAILKQGELVRVDLYVSLPAARNFVVVNDPVPGGLEAVNRDLATASQVDAEKTEVDFAKGAYWYRHQNWVDFGPSRWRFYHQELRHHAVRFYSEYLAAGRYHLTYVAQAIAPGEFTALPTRVEEMYDPETYGAGVPTALVIQSTPPK